MVDRGDYLPTRPDAKEIELEEGFWRNAQVVVPPGKKSVHLRVDADVLAWFKAQGRGHLTRMNAVLRSYMEAHSTIGGRRPCAARPTTRSAWS
jgi:uncharacterized protein (DUF4415 family)